jgi:hypothetical protein
MGQESSRLLDALVQLVAAPATDGAMIQTALVGEYGARAIAPSVACKGPKRVPAVGQALTL